MPRSVFSATFSEHFIPWGLVPANVQEIRAQGRLLFHVPSSTSMSPFRASQDLPVDILLPILEQLSGRADWHACTLVSKLFNRVATPLLYRSLDSRIISKSIVHHPSTTLLRRPEYARYVRHITETGGVHRGSVSRGSNVTAETLEALALCTNLESMAWTDDSTVTDSILLSFLAVVRVHPLRELSIRTHSDLGTAVWNQLITLTGLRKISIWCMEGPPRVLQGWSEALGDTLTHLELGRCTGVPPTILFLVLSQLPKLKDLRLKGAPATSIPTILSYLLDLRSLDTEYPGSYYHRGYRPTSSTEVPSQPPLPALQELTVRTSLVDNFGLQKLWDWILELVPQAGLETLKIHAFTINSRYVNVPRMFLLDFARIHGESLKKFIVGEAQLTLEDVRCLCTKFPNLETLECSTASPNIPSIMDSISMAKRLRVLRFNVHWLPRDSPSLAKGFTAEHARDMMLREGCSNIQTLAINSNAYTGKWILNEPCDECGRGTLEFQILPDVSEDRWQT